MTKYSDFRLGDTAAPNAPMDWRKYEEDQLPAILKASLECFVEAGYHGTSIRTIASRASLSVPGIYHHYGSKQELLIDLVEFAMHDLRRRCTAAVAEAGDDVEKRFDLLIECHVIFHAHQQDLAFIASSEIRALSPSAQSKHIAARDSAEQQMRLIIEEGVRSGQFNVPHPREACRAIITMCTSVAQWYRSGLELSPYELAERYRLLSRKTIGLP